MKPPLTCDIADVPGCDTGPAGRLFFVVTEIRAALRRRMDRKTNSTKARGNGWTS